MGGPRFAVVGTGGVGGYFGARLAQAGCDSVFLARGAHLDAIRRDGLRIVEPDGGFTVAAEATDAPVRIGPVDFALFAVKLWDTEAAAEQCRPLIGPDTAVLSLQNGVDSEPVLARVLGARHVMGGVAEISAAITAPGTVTRFSPFQRIKGGELEPRDDARLRRLGEACEAAGIAWQQPDDIQVAIWTKFTFLVGLSALTALTRRPIGAVRSDPDTRALLRRVVDETVAVGRAKGVALADDLTDRQMAFIDSLPAQMRASMAMDLEKGQRLELPWLSGAVVRMWRELGVDATANGFVLAALKLA